MTDAQRIQERIQGRTLAKTILALGELESQPPNVVEAFWDHLKGEGMIHDMREDRAELDRRAMTITAMTDEEAKAFEKETIAFGQYRGESFGNIPLSYLSWVADSGVKLSKYLQSRLAQSRED